MNINNQSQTTTNQSLPIIIFHYLYLLSQQFVLDYIKDLEFCNVFFYYLSSLAFSYSLANYCQYLSFFQV